MTLYLESIIAPMEIKFFVILGTYLIDFNFISLDSIFTVTLLEPSLWEIHVVDDEPKFL